ncbi:Ptr3p SCDLUD_003530 [Saccharomycodes ludwigii]|uniref:Ptr3p n=1 Tax=Saccharomycodes ludwigii TaxID=36035 RepID=UPI001E834C25|nr:hypothetical protein SCDLUD_003530 [Saccharomycodes ludwigii]KAH3900542.1 hypothetical protein SCDLUD_003530 [Saccharomycodes ludwigii]
MYDDKIVNNDIQPEDFKKIIHDLEQNFYLPKKIILTEDEVPAGRKDIPEQNSLTDDNSKVESLDATKNRKYKVEYGIVNDPIILPCGCIVSKHIKSQLLQDYDIQDFYSRTDSVGLKKDKYNIKYNNLSTPNTTDISNNIQICPVCYNDSDVLKGFLVKPLIMIYNQLDFLKKKYLVDACTDSVNRELESRKGSLTRAGNNHDNETTRRKSSFSKKDGDFYLSDDYQDYYNNNMNNFAIDDIYEDENYEDMELRKDNRRRKSNKTQSLISLFHTVAIKVANSELGSADGNNNNHNNSKVDDKPSGFYTNNTEKVAGEIFDDSVSKTKTVSLKEDKSSTFLFGDTKTSTSVPNNNSIITGTFPNQQKNKLLMQQQFQSCLLKNNGKFDNTAKSKKSLITQQQNATYNKLDEEKEYFFAKCFPMYRKRTQYSTHPKFLRAKSKLFINTDISPDCSKFALITEKKWEIYSIDGNSNETKLFCCGKITGEYGPDFDHLTLPHPDAIKPKTHNGGSETNSSSSKIEWDHLFCKLSLNFLVITGTKGYLRIFDLEKGGEPIYTFHSIFPIRCMDIDYNTNIIACGITGKDRTNGAEQALISFYRIGPQSDDSEINGSARPDHKIERKVSYTVLAPITITLPYRDPINTLQFSQDGNYLSCSTCFESRFLVISTRKISEPRLVMKSIRSIDTSLESEGITDTKIFPGNSNLMCVTAVSFNAPPIVINTKIQNITMTSNQHVAQPTMLLRLDELGSKIYKCEISPRNDSIAFLDKNGTVYIMSSPTMGDSEKRRIVIVEVCANAFRLREAASLRFSSDGHKLYILDRKGNLYIEDFAAGLPQSTFVTKCKHIS